jgi:hypothetical protein
MKKVYCPQQMIEDHLLLGNSITVLEGLRLFRTTETRRIISRLKKNGFVFLENWVKRNGKRHKRWKLF